MKLLLRPDAYRAASSDGVHILTHRGLTRLDGPSLALWIDRLAPHLDGRYTLSELTIGLPADRRDVLERIVTALRDRDVIREVMEDQPAPLSAAEQAEYAPEITYIGYFQDQAATAFAGYRGRTALLIGAGPLLVALARAGLWSGLQAVRLAVVDRDPAELPPLVDESRSWRRDPRQEVEWRTLRGPSEEELTALLTDVDLAVHATTGERSAELLDRCCARLGVLLAQVVVGAEEAWLVPVDHTGSAGGSAGGSFVAAWPRLRGAASPGPAATPPAMPTAVPAAAVTVVANQLIHGVFRALTGRPDPDDRVTLTALRLDTLHSQTHVALPHPFARPATTTTEAQFRARIADLERGERLTEEDFSRRAAPGADPRLGVLALNDGDWAQLPVRICEATVSDPVGLAGGGAARVTTVGFGFTYQQARCQAARSGLAGYGALMVDPRRLLDQAARPVIDPAGTVPADLSAAVAALQAGTLTGAARGYELAGTNRLRLVPVGTVFPALRNPRPSTGAVAGVTAGYAWHDAVLAGLLGHCRHLTIAALAHAAPRRRRVDVCGLHLDEPGARCRDILTDLGELPDVYDVTGSLGVPTLAFGRAERAAVYATGLTVAAAVGEGLLRVLLAVQARVNGDTHYPPPAVTPTPSSAAEVSAVAASLRASGRVMVAVPLDHDPAVTRILPYLVNVVICDE